MFHIGQHVICIQLPSTESTKRVGAPPLIKKGEVYTVREVYPSSGKRTFGMVCLRLEEIRHQARSLGYEPGYAADLFWPLQKLSP